MTFDRPDAQQRDDIDPLAPFRQRFIIDEPALIYLDGNSLGRLPIATIDRSSRLIREEWGRRLIRSWNEAGWWDAPQRIGAQIATLIGARPDEVIIADSTSINLFKLAVAALRHQTGRQRLLTDDLNFPSDLYILQGAIELLGKQHELGVMPSPDGVHGADVAAHLDDQTALLTLSHTVFKSGFTYDIATVTAQAHEVGAMVLWDLSHSAGAVAMDLTAAGVDLAVGCTYKYLNGGPGSPAFLYVRRDLQEKLHNPLSGWLGQRSPFDFALDYRPAAGLRRFLTGTPPMAALALIEPGVALLNEAGIAALRGKSVAQTEYLIALWDAWLRPLGVALRSPRQAAQRGSHVTLAHPEGRRINRTLIEQMKVLPDFRAPDNIRFGITPLYTTYTEIYDAMARLRQVIEEKLYERYDPAERPDVT